MIHNAVLLRKKECKSQHAADTIFIKERTRKKQGKGWGKKGTRKIRKKDMIISDALNAKLYRCCTSIILN